MSLQKSTANTGASDSLVKLNTVYKLISSHTDKYNKILSAECGDYVVEDYPDHTYLSTFKFVPQQDGQLERRIMENHKKHV